MAHLNVVDITSSPPPTASKAPPSSHRLATVSASDALRSLETDAPSNLSSTIESLDAVLSGDGLSTTDGGFERGKVTEIWGPSGAGKTAIMLETAVSALKNGHNVLWVDGSTALSHSRIHSIIDRLPSDAPETDRIGQKPSQGRLRHLAASTLSHLLAMIFHQSSDFPPENTALIVIDGLNTLVDLEYPRFPFSNSTKTEAQKWQSGRRYTILGNIASGLSKLAHINKLAVLVSTGCSTRMRFDSGLGAALVPGVGGSEWEAGIRSRLVIFRDFSGRIVGVQKCQGKSFISREEVGEIGRIIGFDIAADGSLQEKRRNMGGGAQKVIASVSRSPAKPRKRTYDEIADSDGEDVDEYGWGEGDDSALAAADTGGEQDEATIEETIAE